jgi:hypothetical protein
MCELGASVCEYCRGKTHSTGVGIAFEPAITTAVEAAVRSSGRGKVTVSATLKNNQKEARVRTRKSQGENAGTSGGGVRKKGENANPYTARFPVIWN